MTDNTRVFDAAEYLNDIESAAAFLDAVLEEDCDDPSYLTQALGAIARSRSMTEISARTGISRKGLYKALSPEGNPTLATVLKITRALGLRLRAEPRPAAIAA
jgi:probable addiction module antidote protein